MFTLSRWQPYHDTEGGAVSLRKEARTKKHSEKVKAKEEVESQRAELELLI